MNPLILMSAKMRLPEIVLATSAYRRPLEFGLAIRRVCRLALPEWERAPRSHLSVAHSEIAVDDAQFIEWVEMIGVSLDEAILRRELSLEAARLLEQLQMPSGQPRPLAVARRK